MKIIDCEQGSDEWFAARLGKVTASCFSDVLNKKTGRGTYMIKLAAERLTGLSQDGYSNAVMERGKEIEPEAREYYAETRGQIISQIGFAELSEDVGASPDGLVGDDGQVEIKCPNSTTHISYILKNKMPTKYIPQVQGQLWVTGRQWCDFISYDPRLDKRPFWLIRVKRDEDYIKTLEAATNVFIEELKELIAKVGSDTF